MPREGKKKRLQKVEVVWIDACHENEAVARLSKAGATWDLATRTTLGYLVHKDDEKTIVASGVEYHDDDPEAETQVDCVWVIPTGWVKKVRRIK